MKYEVMLKILFELLSKKCVSAAYLANKYEVSKRSIYRYISCIESAGVPIYTVRGPLGGFSVIDTYRLTSTFMTVKEYNQTIGALTAITDSVPDKTLNNVIVKLKATVKNEYNGFDMKSGNLIIDAGPWGDSVGYKSKLLIIEKAIEQNLKLDIIYHDRNGSVTSRTIEPHVIVFKQGLWYVFSFCELRGEFRFFKTGRIESANLSKEHFVRRDISKMDLPLDFWHNSVKAGEIGLEIDKKYLSDAEEWLGIENVSIENEKFVSRVKLPIDDGLVSKIMSFGDGMKVLYPKDLREKIKTRAKELVALYQK